VATIVELKNVKKEDILRDPAQFSEQFFSNGILGFRGLNLGRWDFVEVIWALGFNDAPPHFYDNPGEATPEEPYDHSIQPNCLRMDEDFKPRFESMWNGVGTGGEVPEAGDFYYPGIDEPTRQTFMFWYMDDLQKEHLLRVKSINMHTYTAPPTTGGLGFVDMAQAYLDLPDKWKEGLQEARKLEKQVVWLPEGQLQHPHLVFQDHWFLGHKILMTQGFNSDCEPPFHWDMETVGSFTEEEIQEVNVWTFNYQCDPRNQQWWDWEQGDLLVYDAQQLAVAWSAGFGLGELMFDSLHYNGGYEEDLRGHAPSTGHDPREDFALDPPYEVKPYVVPEGHEYHG